MLSDDPSLTVGSRVNAERSSFVPFWEGRPAWAEIDLDAIAHNVKELKRIVGEGVALIAVVKANAYGHGAVPVATSALLAGADSLAVACVDEGIELRRANLKAPILIMGHTPPWEAERVVEYGLTPTVDSHSLASGLSSAAERRGIISPFQIKIDTGMGRFGLLPGEFLSFCKSISELPALRLVGCFTHFACADEPERCSTINQLRCFEELLVAARDAGVASGIRHAANTAGAINFPQSRLDAVRCGLGILGLQPAGTAIPTLKPALQLKACLARVRLLPGGTAIGYGGTAVLKGESLVGLVPVGYADGLPRSLSNLGSVLVNGRRSPIVGRISMDQTTIGLDGNPARLGDEVVILGRQGNECILAEEIAQRAGTIHYEILTGVPPRLPRVFKRGGEAVFIQTLLDGCGSWRTLPVPPLTEPCDGRASELPGIMTQS